MPSTTQRTLSHTKCHTHTHSMRAPDSHMQRSQKECGAFGFRVTALLALDAIWLRLLMRWRSCRAGGARRLCNDALLWRCNTPRRAEGKSHRTQNPFGAKRAVGQGLHHAKGGCATHNPTLCAARARGSIQVMRISPDAHKCILESIRSPLGVNINADPIGSSRSRARECTCSRQAAGLRPSSAAAPALTNARMPTTRKIWTSSRHRR